jgi:hypothetical protein
MEQLITLILNYDKQFGRPKEGSDKRRAAYDEIVKLANEKFGKIIQNNIDS